MFINVASLHRDAALSTSSSEFTVVFNQPIDLNRLGHTLKLVRGLLPNTVYNITANNNNLDFFENATVLTATLTAGYYTADELSTHIGTVMTTTSGGHNIYTVAVDDATSKMTFAATNAFTIQLGTGSHASATNNLWRLLGFKNSAGTAAADSSSGTSVTAPFMVNVATPQSFLCVLSFNGHPVQNVLIGNQSTMVSMVIPNIEMHGYINSFSADDLPLTVKVDDPLLYRIDVALYDQFMQLIDLNGSEWELIFEFCQ